LAKKWEQQMPQVQANGISLEYESYGSPTDPALVLIRGLGTQLIYWPKVLLDGLVARGFRVTTFDNRDVGLSQKFDEAGVPDVMGLVAQMMAGEKAEAPYITDDMAADVIGLMDVLEIDRAHVMGISMGGMIAQVVAAQNPDRVLSLASIMSSSGAPGLPSATPEAQSMMITPPPSTDRETVVRHSVEGHRVIESPAHPEPDDFLFEIFGYGFDRCYYPEGAARQMAAIIAGGDRSGLLKTITVPSLVIHGDADPLVPLACGQDTAEKIPGATLEVIEGMGHDVPRALMPTWIELIVANAGRAG